jgi:hypothetical protein
MDSEPIPCFFIEMPSKCHGGVDNRKVLGLRYWSRRGAGACLCGFDLAMKLEGLKKWGDLCRKGVEEGKHVDGCSEPSRLLE